MSCVYVTTEVCPPLSPRRLPADEAVQKAVGSAIKREGDEDKHGEGGKKQVGLGARVGVGHEVAQAAAAADPFADDRANRGNGDRDAQS